MGLAQLTKTLHRPGRLDTRTPRRRTPNSARTPQSSENASLATQNRPGGQSPRTSGLREDSATFGKCCPGHTEWPGCPEPMDLRTPRGLRATYDTCDCVRCLKHTNLFAPIGARPPRGLREESAGFGKCCPGHTPRPAPCALRQQKKHLVPNRTAIWPQSVIQFRATRRRWETTMLRAPIHAQQPFERQPW